MSTLGMDNNGPLCPLHSIMEKPQALQRNHWQTKGVPSREHTAVLCVLVLLQVLLQPSKYQTLICMCFLMLTLQQQFSSMCQSLPEDKSISMLNPTSFSHSFQVAGPSLAHNIPTKKKCLPVIVSVHALKVLCKGLIGSPCFCGTEPTAIFQSREQPEDSKAVQQFRNERKAETSAPSGAAAGTLPLLGMRRLRVP